MATATRTVRPISAPQTNFINSLIEQRELSEEIWAAVVEVQSGEMTTRQASALIDVLKAQPWKAKAGAVAEDDLADEAGIYEVDGLVFQIKANREKTNLYAMKLVDAEYVYVGAIYKAKIKKTDRITVDRAIELSGMIGQCIRCSRTLTAEKSVRQAMGPVCIKKI
jgi:hypothetical protein